MYFLIIKKKLSLFYDESYIFIAVLNVKREQKKKIRTKMYLKILQKNRLGARFIAKLRQLCNSLYVGELNTRIK